MKQKFKVIAAFTTYGTLEVEASTREEASDIAQNTDGGDFFTDDSMGDFGIVSVDLISKDRSTSLIEWDGNSISDNEIIGRVNGNIMFVIDRKGKRKVQFILKSYPFHNNVFTRANNYKKLYTHADVDKVKSKAQLLFNDFVKRFTQ